MKLKSNRSRSKFWSEHITAFHSSGLTRAEYCRQNGIKAHQMAYHLKTQEEAISNDSPSPFVPTGFARVEHVPAELIKAPPVSIEPTTDNVGVSISFGRGTDPVWAARFLAALGGGAR